MCGDVVDTFDTHAALVWLGWVGRVGGWGGYIAVVVLGVRAPEYYMLVGTAAHLNAGAFWW